MKKKKRRRRETQLDSIESKEHTDKYTRRVDMQLVLLKKQKCRKKTWCNHTDR